MSAMRTSCRWLRLLNHHSQARHDRSVGRERSLAVQNANVAHIRAYNEALLMPSRCGARSGTVDKLANDAMLGPRGVTISVTCEAHLGIRPSPSLSPPYLQITAALPARHQRAPCHAVRAGAVLRQRDIPNSATNPVPRKTTGNGNGIGEIAARTCCCTAA